MAVSTGKKKKNGGTLNFRKLPHEYITEGTIKKERDNMEDMKNMTREGMMSTCLELEAMAQKLLNTSRLRPR